MKTFQHHALTVLMALVGLSSVAAQAAERMPQVAAAAGTTANIRGLSPAQLSAIRSIGRNVLTAKKTGGRDSEDVAQLASLRASVNALIAADIQPVPITVAGEESRDQRSQRDKVARLREAARGDARALVAQLRSRSELKAARA